MQQNSSIISSESSGTTEQPHTSRTCHAVTEYARESIRLRLELRQDQEKVKSRFMVIEGLDQSLRPGLNVKSKVRASNMKMVVIGEMRAGFGTMGEGPDEEQVNK